MNRVDKRGSKNNETKDGSEEGNNIDDSYAEECRLEMEAVQKFKERQDKILYQKELLKEQ